MSSVVPFLHSIAPEISFEVFKGLYDYIIAKANGLEHTAVEAVDRSWFKGLLDAKAYIGDSWVTVVSPTPAKLVKAQIILYRPKLKDILYVWCQRKNKRPTV